MLLERRSAGVCSRRGAVSVCRSQRQCFVGFFYFFLANTDILICFAMKNPSVIQKLLPRIVIKGRILFSCRRTLLSCVPYVFTHVPYVLQ